MQDLCWVEVPKGPKTVGVVALSILLELAAGIEIDFRTAIVLEYVLVLSAFEDKGGLFLAACSGIQMVSFDAVKVDSVQVVAAAQGFQQIHSVMVHHTEAVGQ